MSVTIVLDSTADLREGIQKHFRVLPLTIRFGNEEYLDGVTITHEEFYDKLVESDVMPTTSQASPFAFEAIFREEVERGNDVVAITVSEKLSGTFQSANIAAEEFPGRVFVVDSRSVAIGSGILAERALELREEGLEACRIAEILRKEREEICVVALLDTLEYLKRGGRISKATALAGSMLSIKPVVSLGGGEIRVLGKARGSRQGNNLLAEQIHRNGGVNFQKPLLLGYTGLSDALLQKYIADSAAMWEGEVEKLPVALIGSVVGTHAGPNAIAVAFFRKNQTL